MNYDDPHDPVAARDLASRLERRPPIETQYAAAKCWHLLVAVQLMIGIPDLPPPLTHSLQAIIDLLVNGIAGEDAVLHRAAREGFDGTQPGVAIDLAARVARRPPVRFFLLPAVAWRLVATIQLLLRNPAIPEGSRRELYAICIDLVEKTAGDDAILRLVLMRGFDPAYDTL